MKPDVIIGGGVAGLAAAQYLCENSSRSVVVLEAEDRLGGLASTFEWKGCRLDYGPHRIFTLLPGMRDYLLDILDHEVFPVKRRSSIHLMERYLNYPISLGEVMSALGPAAAFRIGLSYAVSLIRSPFQSPPEKQSYSDYIRSRFGDYLYRLLFEDYARKVWLEQPHLLSSDMAITRLSSPSLLATAWAALRGQKTGAVSEFLYPRGGIGRLSERLGEEIERGKGEVRLGNKVESIVIENRKVVALRGTTPQGTFEIEPDHVVSTLPLPSLFASFEPGAPHDIELAVQKLPFASSILTYVLCDVSQVRPDSWLYFPEEDVIFTRIYEVDNFDRQNVPEGLSCLCVEVPCRKGDRIWSMTDREIAEKVKEDLTEVDLGPPQRWIDTITVRLEDVYPIYYRNYREPLKEINEWLATTKNLLSTGRGGAFCYNNIDHSIDMGRLAGEYLLSQKKGGADNMQFYRLRSRYDQYRIVD